MHKRFCYCCGSEKTQIGSDGYEQWYLNEGTPYFLCIGCYKHLQFIPLPRLSLNERFWSRVSWPVGIGECWQWLASKDTDGYGQFAIKKRKVKPHRFAYEMLFGKIPTGLQIDHLCRNRACVNPYHMEVVISKINTLRGNAVSAINMRKTHCIRGHELTEENTLSNPKLRAMGYRSCKICWKEWFQSYYTERRDELNATRREKRYAADLLTASQS